MLKFNQNADDAAPGLAGGDGAKRTIDDRDVAIGFWAGAVDTCQLRSMLAAELIEARLPLAPRDLADAHAGCSQSAAPITRSQEVASVIVGLLILEA